MKMRVYFVIFISIFLAESIFWRGIIDGLIPAFLTVIVIYLLDVKGALKHSLLNYKEPYIIGDSGEIEYLTGEELEERLKKSKYVKDDVKQ